MDNTKLLQLIVERDQVGLNLLQVKSQIDSLKIAETALTQQYNGLSEQLEKVKQELSESEAAKEVVDSVDSEVEALSQTVKEVSDELSSRRKKK